MIFSPSGGRLAEAAEIGGKAASLARLAAMGFPVPDFFVIPAGAYRKDGRVPPDLAAAIVSAWRGIAGDGRAVAVRSSGVAEDSADNSFAGVFATVLDVRDEAAVIKAVEECWHSHTSPEAAAYRAARSLGDDSAMAVVVQRMVQADWSGVAFTADPVSQALSVTLLSIVDGQGERLVSGLVNPIELRFDTASGVEESRIVPAGMTPPSDTIIGEIVATASAVATAYAFPQDVEWAVEGGKLWLLQSRPITTVAGVFNNRALEPWAPAGRPDDASRVWTRAYADEIWTPPVTPLFYDIQYLGGVITNHLKLMGDTDATPPDIFKYYRAAPYLDASLLRRMYATLPRIMRRPGILGMLPAEESQRLKDAPWSRRAILGRVWDFEFTNRRIKSLKHNHRVLAAGWDPFMQRTAALLAIDRTALDDIALDAHLTEVWATAGTVGVNCGYAVFNHSHDLKFLLTGLLERWCGGGEQLYAAVTSGLEDSIAVKEADDIFRLAQQIRAGSDGAAEAAQQGSWEAFRPRAASFGLPTFPAAFDAFRDAHAHRGADYKDPIHPRWGDDAELLWASLKPYLAAGARRPSEVNRNSAAARRSAQRKALDAVSGATAPMRRAILRWLFHYNQIYAGIRDNHRFYYDRIWYLLRLTYLEKGRRLSEAGRLAHPTDVFFLCRKEIEALASGDLDAAAAAARIGTRRQDYEHTREVQPPKFIRAGYVEMASLSSRRGDSIIAGIGASPGHARGIARVAHSIADLGRVGEGDILITRQTDPGWTPAFSRLGGLVLETGGVLAHGASLCREFGVPCVTAVENATQLIPDGSIIALSGGAGTIEILDAEREAAALAD